MDWNEAAGEEATPETESDRNFPDRLLEVLRHSPVLHLPGNQTVTLRSIRPPARTLSLSAEAVVEASAPGQQPSLADGVDEAVEADGRQPPLSPKPVALVFGPENGAVSEKLVFEAAKEAEAKRYTHLYVLGFSIEPKARELVQRCVEAVGIPATYVAMTMDLTMGDLLKNMRSSQIFSVCGLPEIELLSTPDGKYQVKLLGLDTFDPIDMKPTSLKGDDVPAWFLDADYNGLCFRVTQAFFPRTAAWDNLKRSLKAEFEDSVWAHLSGSVSAPFEPGEHREIAVKVIDDRGNELLVTRSLEG
jgi:adenine-specific DNA-methyltransferase